MRATGSDRAARAAGTAGASPASRRRQRWLAPSACVLALLLLLLWAATFSRTWHALEFKTFDVLTALTAPYRTTLPVVILAID
ncbi:MAG: hypothetical protein EOO29_47080, partial [Comamonadaceae bacterium]